MVGCRVDPLMSSSRSVSLEHFDDCLPIALAAWGTDLSLYELSLS